MPLSLSHGHGSLFLIVASIALTVTTTESGISSYTSAFIIEVLLLAIFSGEALVSAAFGVYSARSGAAFWMGWKPFFKRQSIITLALLLAISLAIVAFTAGDSGKSFFKTGETSPQRILPVRRRMETHFSGQRPSHSSLLLALLAR